MSVKTEGSDKSVVTPLNRQSTQVFENLAKKLHRLESKLGNGIWGVT